MLRVAAYCRVSTDKDDQANSFESQQRYFREYIERNPEWELVQIFADEGISGTNTKKRKEFNRMIRFAKAGEVDLIITKEVSRFARNTVDTLQYTRDLKKNDVYVLFMNDNINTKDPDAELRLTIMASIAQEEYVVLRDHHEPIISREIFEKAQKELERRSPSKEQKAKHSNRYCLSGKIQCGCCGSRFVSRTKKRKDGSQYKAWRCFEAAQHGLPKTDQAGNQIGCAVNQQIRDEDFMLMLQMVIKHLQHNKKRLISDLVEIVKLVLSASEGEEMDIGKLEQKLETTAEKKERLLDLYLGQDISKDDYRRMSERYDTDMENLKQRIKEAKKQKEITANQEEMMADIAATIRALALGEKQDDTFYRNIVEKIVVHSREHIEIYLNLLPYKWSYMLAELPGNPSKKNGGSEEHFATSLPVSVSKCSCFFSVKGISPPKGGLI